MMNIKNYTSTVPSMNSAAAIEQLLVEAGATTVTKFYNNDKQLSGFFFQIIIGQVSHTFKLPANVEEVTAFMLKQARNPDTKKRQAIRAQAYRTAWRTLHEMVQIQVAQIQMRQMEPLQVFLAQSYDSRYNCTAYESMMQGREIKLLGS